LSYDIKLAFAETFKDPEKCLAKLREAYIKHTEMIASDTLWKDDGAKFFESDKNLAQWAVEPSQATDQVAVAAAMPGPLPTNNVMPPSSGFLQGGYAGVIVLSVAILSMVFLAADNIMSPGLAGFFIVIALLLFFGRGILEILLKLLPVGNLIDKEKSIADLFEEAHDEFRRAIIGISNTGKYENSGILHKDPATIAKMRTVSKLSNIYREIFYRSEKEWYQRTVVQKTQSIEMVKGTANSTSDVPG